MTTTSYEEKLLYFYDRGLAFVDSLSFYHKPILSFILVAAIQIFVDKPYIQIDDIIDIQANQTIGTIDKFYPDFEISFELKVNGNLTSELVSSITGFLKNKKIQTDG